MTETVAVVGDYIKGEDAGAAYVFRRTGDGWREEAKLLSSYDAMTGANSSAVYVFSPAR